MRVTSFVASIVLLFTTILPNGFHAAAKRHDLRPSAFPTQAATLGEEHSLKGFTGVIGMDLKVIMLLERRGDDLSGCYVYEKVGSNIDLSGKVNSRGEFELKEFIYKTPWRKELRDVLTGVFKGRFASDNAIEGTWTKANGSTPLPFSLKQIDSVTVGQFQGEWEYKKQGIGLSFSVHLNQKGLRLDGTYEAITANAARVDSDMPISGKLNGSTAQIEFEAHDGRKGKATLFQYGKFLLWSHDYSVGVDSYDPMQAILQKAKGKKGE